MIWMIIIAVAVGFVVGWNVAFFLVWRDQMNLEKLKVTKNDSRRSATRPYP
jgi:hypothetical protein